MTSADQPAATGDADLASLVAAAALGVPGVVAMHAGSFGEVATYLPHRRVAGVRVRDDSVAVHVVARLGVGLTATAQAIRDAVTPLVGRPVSVVVEDVEP